MSWDNERMLLHVPIQTFAPEPYSVLQPMSVLIEDSEDGYLASLIDANIGATGETQQEAFENLKSLILDIFDSLSREAPERLGPEPARQLAVLRGCLASVACNPHPRPLSRPHTRTPGRGE